MGLVDIFTPDKTIEIKFGELCELMKETAKNELLENAIKTEVPHRYIRQMLSGKMEEPKEQEADPAVESDSDHINEDLERIFSNEKSGN